jgi:hypothetical protein
MPPAWSRNWDNLSRADMVLIRRAIREGWPVPDVVCRPIVQALCRAMKSPSRRRVISAAQTLADMSDLPEPPPRRRRAAGAGGRRPRN